LGINVLLVSLLRDVTELW